MRKFNMRTTQKSTSNEKKGSWLEEINSEMLKAINIAKNTPDEIKNKNIKYLLKR